MAWGRRGRLVINGNSSQKKIDDAVSAYTSAGYVAEGYRFDVTSEEEVESAVEQIESDVGPIDILVNNAGIIRRVPLLDMPVEEWELVVKTDLTSAFIVSKAVVGRMVTRGGGKVINICSMMSELGRDAVGEREVLRAQRASAARSLEAARTPRRKAASKC